MAVSTPVQKEKEGRTLRAKMLTAGILLALFVLAMAIRCVWYYGPAVAPAGTYGDLHYVVSGNDPDYHKRAIDYALETGHALSWDPLMNYPVGGPNPNPPAFAWSSMFIGIALSPFFNFDVLQSVWMFFLAVPAFWAALTVFPVYFFTRDMFGRKPAYVSSFIIAIMAGNVERTPLGFSDHDSFVVFFVVTAFFFLMRALKNLDDRNWVRKWGVARDISTGMLSFLRQQRISIIYAVMAGFSIAAVMLAWKGVAYIFAILTMYLIVHVMIKRFRKEDPLGITMVVIIATGVALLVSFPYYYNMLFINWYETPFFVFVALGLFAAIMVPTRNLPYIIILAGLALAVSIGFVVIYFYLPGVYNLLLGFQGYFVHDKLYQTIAEAQPPDFSRMVYSYGEYIFYFGLVAVIYQAYRLPKEHYRNDYIFGIAWFAMAIYMAMSAVRFMYNATPVFAILGGWVTWVILDLLDFKKMVKTYKGLSGGGRWHAVKSSVKVRHLAGAFFIGYMVLASTTFYGLDAGIPYETKKQFDNDIYNFLPSQLRPAGYDPSGSSLWWFGSFGTAFPSDYWTDAMFWLQTQDTNLSDEDRPAFVAWWDYGHWCMHMGHHPSIADNFQQGVQISGCVITAQTEKEAIALFIARITDANDTNPAVVPILDKYLGVDGRKDFQNIQEMLNTPHWRTEVLSRPGIYGNRTKDINDLNVKWAALSGLLTSKLPKDRLVNMYDELTRAIGKDIRYFAADSRMFPFAARNTGIYYAPVKLSDQDINKFLTVKAVGSDGQEYDPSNIPLSVRQETGFKIVDYKLYYNEPFYNSMFYRAYVGYGPADVGIAQDTYGYTDIPSMVGNMRTGQYPPMQGWNMTNFRLEYRTAYWNPYNESTGLANHTGEWKVVPPWTGQKYQNESNGVVDYFYRNLYQGVFMLKYYNGAIISGTVTTSTGKPVPNARVTVYDDLPLAVSYYPGVPHGCTFTDPSGKYSILAPYGNVTVFVTNGGQTSADDLLLVKETRLLGNTNFYVSDEQAMRNPTDVNADGILDYNIKKDFTVSAGNLSGRAYYDLNNTGSYEDGDTPLTGRVLADNASLGTHYVAPIDASGNYSIVNLTPADYELTVDYEGTDVAGGSVSVDPSAAATQDIKLTDITVSGNLTYENGTPAGALSIGVVSSTGEVLWQNASLDNGTYMVEKLLPGNYKVSVVSDGHLREEIPIEVNQSANITLELVAVPLQQIFGRVNFSAGGLPAPGTVISFQGLDNSSRSATAIARADGSFSAGLARGNYTVYAVLSSGSDIFVDLASLAVPSPTGRLDLSLEKGIKLNGTAYRDFNGNGAFDPSSTGAISDASSTTPPTLVPEYQVGATVELESPDGRLLLPSNLLGFFETYLPAGRYVVRAERNVSETESYVNVTVIDLAAPLQLNLSLNKGVLVTGTVFWDRNGNDSPDPGDEVAGARVLFSERNHPERTIEAFTAYNGTYSLFLGQLVDLNVDVSARGYNVTRDLLSTGTDPITRNLKIAPAATQVDIFLTSGGSAAPSGLHVTLVASFEGTRGANLTTDARGHVSAPLLPGQYTIDVGQNVSGPLGAMNLTLVRPFTVEVGQAALTVNYSLDMKVYMAGVVYYDENGDGVPQRTEYRNALVKFVPENQTGDVTASLSGIPVLPAVVSQSTVEGRYEIGLAPGNYTLWTLLELVSPQGPDLVFIKKVTVDRSGVLNLSLTPACKVRGQVFVDLDHNGRLDDGEARSGVPVAFSENGSVLLTVGSDPNGYFELSLPQGRNCTAAVDNTTNETLSESVFVPIRYDARLDLQLPMQPLLIQNISLTRKISTQGRVTYDRDADGTTDDNEGVAGIEVIFTGANNTRFGAMTNSTGDYAVYLTAGHYDLSVNAPGFNSSIAAVPSVDVALESSIYNFSLAAVNATLALELRAGQQQAQLPGGASVVLQALDARAVNATGRTDARGRLRLSVSPGIYSMYINGARLGTALAYIGALDLEPSGPAVEVTVNLSPATRLWGAAFYTNEQGSLTNPGYIDLVLNTTLTVSGRNFTATLNFTGVAPVYELFLPAANFTVDASFITSVRGQNISYTLSQVADTAQAPGQAGLHLDIPLQKVKDLTLNLTWDETQKLTIPTGGKANYTMYLTNLGNERTNIDLQISKPTGWSVNLSIKKVTLEIGENLTVLVNMTAPADASAGDNMITINASASEMPYKFAKVTQLVVNVIQSFGVNLTSPPASASTTTEGMVYTLSVANTGNGDDTFNLSVSGPNGWTLVLSEYNPAVGGGQTKDIQLTATPFAGARIEKGLTARLRAVSKNELTPPKELIINLTFPKLNAGLGNITGKGVSLPSQNLPGFETAGAMGAVMVAVAVVALRRRRSR